MKKAYIFPGQGSQFPGMGKDLYENNPSAREMFEKAFAKIPPSISAALLEEYDKFREIKS